MREPLKLKVLVPIAILTTLLLLISWKLLKPNTRPTDPFESRETESPANWEVYQSKNQHYEIRYPSDFYLKEYAAEDISISNYDMRRSGYSMGGDPQIAPEKQGILVLSIINYTFKDISAEEYLSKWKEKFENDGLQPFPPSILGSVTIDNVNFVKTQDYSYGFDENIISYYAEHNGKLYKIGHHFRSKEPDPKLEYTFEKIMFTFKFLD